MRTLRYWLVLVVLAAAAVACFVIATSHGLSGIGLLATAGVLVLVAVLFSYALTMRGKHHTPIAR